MKNLIKIALIVSLSVISSVASNTASVEELSERINKYQGLASLYLQRAKYKIQDKKLKEAGSDLSRAIAIDPALEEAQVVYAYILIQQNKTAQARPLIATLMDTTTDNANLTKAHILLGDIQMLEDNVDEALTSYKKVFEITDLHKQIHYIKVANAYYELGLFNKSIQTLKSGLSTMIVKEKLREAMVDLSMKEGNYTLALAVLNTMIEDNSGNSKLYYKKAQVLKAQGKMKLMKLEIKKAELTYLKNVENKDAKLVHINLYAKL